MSLKNKITEDLKTAFKAGKSETVSTLRFLNSAIKNKELEKRSKLSREGKSIDELEKLSELTDEETINVILSEIKKREKSIVLYNQGNREDLVKKETAELEIVKKYVSLDEK